MNNESLPSLLSSKNWVIFSAQNPDNKQLSESENKHLHERLLDKLRRLDVKFEAIHGCYDGKHEDGVILYRTREVSNIDASLIALAHGQESVLTHQGLVYQDSSIAPVTAWTILDGEPNDNYTLLRGEYFQAQIDFSHKI